MVEIFKGFLFEPRVIIVGFLIIFFGSLKHFGIRNIGKTILYAISGVICTYIAVFVVIYMLGTYLPNQITGHMLK